jgi:palmitoyltransferase
MHLKTKAFQVIWPLNISLFLMLTAFAGWNWYLALKGFTTIEFWDRGRAPTYEKAQILENL